MVQSNHSQTRASNIRSPRTTPIFTVGGQSVRADAIAQHWPVSAISPLGRRCLLLVLGTGRACLQ
jgi:hypothetical protein